MARLATQGQDTLRNLGFSSRSNRFFTFARFGPFSSAGLSGCPSSSLFASCLSFSLSFHLSDFLALASYGPCLAFLGRRSPASLPSFSSRPTTLSAFASHQSITPRELILDQVPV